MLNTPVVYIFFNRPDTVQKTFPAIRAQRPTRLHLIADGPRPTRDTDRERCQQARQLVESMIDWKCEVTRDFSDVNLGCGKRLSSGLTRAFAELGEAIILEDDILPHPDFFAFCTRHLELYRNEPKVHSICGFNPIGQYLPRRAAAVPTVFNNIWGWASWQRAWRDYHFDLPDWEKPETRDQIRRFLGSDLVYNWHAHDFEKLNQGIDTWDFQWTYTMLRLQRVALVTSTNFVQNVGFAADATHTQSPEPYIDGLRVYSAVAPDRQPSSLEPDRLHDKLYSEVILSPSKWKIGVARAAARSPLLQRLLKSKLS